MSRPTIQEILAHDNYADAIWRLTPTKNGKLQVAHGRGGPIGIDWEVHGTGQKKLIFIPGLGTIKTTWQRLTCRFGHEESDQYSVLIFDNRGMGKSDIPILRYSTSEMAKDLIELLDHIGWTESRQLHVMGSSMGGMIAQEVACAIPDRVASLALVSTAAYVENTTGYFENLRQRFSMFMPKTLDRSLKDAAATLFSAEYLDRPDETTPPSSSTRNITMPTLPDGTSKARYGTFGTNYERWAAAELHKRLDRHGAFTRRGLLLQGVAAGWHCKTRAQLEDMAERVGRDRILIMHGSNDAILSAHLGRKLIEHVRPGVGVVREGHGHVLMLEDSEWHTQALVELWAKF